MKCHGAYMYMYSKNYRVMESNVWYLFFFYINEYITTTKIDMTENSVKYVF